MTNRPEGRPPEAPPPEPKRTGGRKNGAPRDGGGTPPPGLFTWALLIALALAPMMFLVARGGPEPDVYKRQAYTHILRTRELDGQDTPDRFGSLSLSYQF